MTVYSALWQHVMHDMWRMPGEQKQICSWIQSRLATFKCTADWKFPFCWDPSEHWNFSIQLSFNPSSPCFYHYFLWTRKRAQKDECWTEHNIGDKNENQLNEGSFCELFLTILCHYQKDHYFSRLANTSKGYYPRDVNNIDM